MEVSETKFNMSAATLGRLNDGLIRAAAYYERGMLHRYIICLKNIKLSAMFKFSPEERRQLAVYEYKYAHQRNIIKKWKVAEDYHENLLDDMNKYGLLLPDKIKDANTSY